MSTNRTHTEIRQKSKFSEYIQWSLQSCQQSDTANILESHLLCLQTDSIQNRHMRALIYINECLHAMLKCPAKTTLRKAVVLWHLQRLSDIPWVFIWTKYYYVSKWQAYQKALQRTLTSSKIWILCIYRGVSSNRVPTRQRPDSCDYEGFFAELFSKVKDNEIELINKELVSSLISVMDTEWDKKVLRVFLDLDRSRREVDALDIDSDSLVWDRNMVFGLINSVPNVEKEAEQVLFETLNRKIERNKTDIKKYKTKLS